ncbi:biotin/lipoyl-containing protein [Neobacillus niacini]|uniref:acetyl-CoA carboxylase biotin carboxyl carrier protein n=1 Tax=Neobacillus niacini TaxID=86668 RepID=UPI00285CC4C3|nr:biotin/lipoyl-containing protein [Neobacillus niacini]MDR6998352.1 acetyl-CoA carboxylase biotin carboxyl carrier protein [Neobacillus niacini]
MIKMLEIREMLRLVEQSSLEKLEVINSSFRISIKKGSTKQTFTVNETVQQLVNISEEQISDTSEAMESLVDENPQPHVLQSYYVGKFQPLLKKGDIVEIGSQIGHCTVEALKLTHEIKSDINGVIENILVEEGQLVDFGQPLYKVAVRKEMAHV